MKTKIELNQKFPWKPEFFNSYIQNYDLSQIYQAKFLFYMPLSYNGFLRISELLNLNTQDLVIDSQNSRLIVNI